MTVQRLIVVTLAAASLLAAAIAASLVVDRSDPAAASPDVAATEVANAPSADATQADPAQPTPVATATATPVPLPTARPIDVIDVEPPALVSIPADLIATPTPEGGGVSGPLPILTNIPATPRDGSVVYLTFDDGPDPVYTNQVLDVLARYNARATFFVIGNSVDAYPGVVQRMIAEGHTVGNHTYFHEALPLEEDDHIAQTLAATNAAMSRAAGVTSSCMRPPYGSLDERSFNVIAGQGYTVHMWDVDSEDWKTNDAYTIAAEVLSTTSLGDRILFHDGPSNRAATVAALESVLDVLSARGVQFQALNC